MYKFEDRLAEFCGSPYAVSVDCCTHAIELCMRYLEIKKCQFTSYTYLSVPQTMRLLGIDHTLTGEQWSGEYRFHGTPVWDSARLLQPGMYRPGEYQCLSFGPGKPVDNVRGGAILCDSIKDYKTLKMMSYDGRDPTVNKWQDQEEFIQGFHYMMRWEEEYSALEKLNSYITKGVYEHEYPPYFDCRIIKII